MDSHHDRPTIACYPSPFKSLDMVTSEAIIDSRGLIYLMNADGTPPLPEMETTAKVVWNAKFLFALFRGRFVSLRVGHALSLNPKSGKTFLFGQHADLFELFIGADMGRGGEYHEFQLAPDSRYLGARIRREGSELKSDPHRTSGFRGRSFVHRTSQTWDGVMEIPWSVLGMDYQTKCEWNLNFYRSSGEEHDGELLAWSPVGTGEKAFHRTEKFGRMVFVR